MRESFFIYQCYIFTNLLCYVYSSVKVGNSNSINQFWKYRSIVGDANIRWNTVQIDDPKLNVLFVHGFGGNADQFRKNMPYLANQGYQPYAIDLLGYGYSDKPNPKLYETNYIYNFENFADQTLKFVDEVVRQPCVLVGHSVGAVVTLQSAAQTSKYVKGVVLINASLRMLNVRKQSAFQKPVISFIQVCKSISSVPSSSFFSKFLQTLLRETEVGKFFFKQVAQPEALRNILKQAYADPNSITDEILNVILQPGLQPGAAEVFLDFISYSSGPLPEDLLPKIDIPVRILWGENDPWEPIQLGRELAKYSCVDAFVPLPGAGHCPMDQIPELVNIELVRFLETFKSK